MQEKQIKPNVKQLLTLLKAESCRVSNFFIVLDALDEFDDKDDSRAAILGELNQIKNTRIMITGRTHVQSTVTAVISVEELATLAIRASDSDIRKYLNARIKKGGRLGQVLMTDEKLRDTVVEGIVTKADGM